MALGERARAAVESWPVIILAFVVLGSIYFGFATVTEAAAVGLLGALVLSFWHRTATGPVLLRSLLNTARTVGFIFLILIGALIFRFFLTYLKAPLIVTNWIVGLDVPPLAVLIGVVVAILVMGTFLDALAIVLIVVPVILKPMLHLGFDPIWLGIVLTIAVEMGLTTPPFGMNLFVVQGIAKGAGVDVSYGDVVKGSLPYLVVDAMGLAMVMVFPSVALWLPVLLRG